MKKHAVTIILVLVMLVGVALLLYPSVADYWNERHASRAIATYVEAVADINDETYTRMWQEAEEYNTRLAKTGIRWKMDTEQMETYQQLLNIDGSGIMGYIEIPQIDVMLPIYHGTEEAVLQIAIGHIAYTSLPVGGAGTHCVISGHSGLRQPGCSQVWMNFMKAISS